MTKSTARVRALRVTVVVFLFAAVIIGPQAFIKAPHFDDFSLVRPLAAQGTANYTYTVIADGTSCSSPLGRPVLNNVGEAAFRAGCGPSTVVSRGDGSGPLTDIYTFTSGSGFLVPKGNIGINDQGAVAFTGVTDVSRYAILVGNGGPVSVVVDTAVHTQFSEVGDSSINNVGAVAFMASTTTIAADTVAVAQGGAITTIAGPGTPTPTGGALSNATLPAPIRSGVRRRPRSASHPRESCPLQRIWNGSPRRSD